MQRIAAKQALTVGCVRARPCMRCHTHHCPGCWQRYLECKTFLLGRVKEAEEAPEPFQHGGRPVGTAQPGAMSLMAAATISMQR